MVMVISYALVVLFCICSVLLLGSTSRFYLASSVGTSPNFASNQDHSRQQQKSVIRWVPQASTSRVKSHISCDRSHYHYDLCSVNGPAVLDPTTSTFYVTGPTQPKYFMDEVRPYPRKWDSVTMSKIKKVTLFSGPRRPICDIQHNTSAIVFSAGGYTGNFFHDFNEGFLPLFITVRSMFLTDQDVVLVIAKSPNWWVSKYADILSAFSKHPIVNLDNATSTHCFRSVTVGLMSHGFLTINPNLMSRPTNLSHFHAFLNKAYSQAHHFIPQHKTSRPKLVLLSRTGNVGRVILNQAQLKTMAVKMGFIVILFEPKPNVRLSEAYGFMNESHAVIGVHGAAMTHLLFMRPGSVFIQVVPIGTDGVAELCYGKPAKEMGLDYMEYKVEIEESSLIEKYNTYDPILNDPMSVSKKGWALLKKVYLKEQDVRLDLFRFRKYLRTAYKKAERFMYRVG